MTKTRVLILLVLLVVVLLGLIVMIWKIGPKLHTPFSSLLALLFLGPKTALPPPSCPADSTQCDDVCCGPAETCDSTLWGLKFCDRRSCPAGQKLCQTSGRSACCPASFDCDTNTIGSWPFKMNVAVCVPPKSERGPVCGQNGCESGENCSSCPQDCGSCKPHIETRQEPPPVRELYLAVYLMEGDLHQAHGLQGTNSRDTYLLPRLATLKKFGFKRFVVAVYPGVAKDLATAKSYFGPIEAAGVDVIPGVPMNDIFFNVPGWFEESTPPNYDYKHAKNPTGTTEAKFWETFENIVTMLGNSVRSRTVYIDTEYVYWLYRTHGFWTNENLSIVRQHLETMSQHLRDKNIRILTYHPIYQPSEPNITRITEKLYGNSDAAPAYGYTQHFVASPYFKPETIQWTWAQEKAWYDSHGITDAGLGPKGVNSRLSQGFLMWHQTRCLAEPLWSQNCLRGPGGEIIWMGWNLREFRDAWIRHPEYQSGWFFLGSNELPLLDSELAVLPPFCNQNGKCDVNETYALCSEECPPFP